MYVSTKLYPQSTGLLAAFNAACFYQDRPDTERHGLALTEFAAWRVDIFHTTVVRSKQLLRSRLNVTEITSIK